MPFPARSVASCRPFFRRFEPLLHPYPKPEPALPPQGFFSFVWACTAGLRGYIGWLALLSGSGSAFEALLFWMLGQIVDWIGHAHPDTLWQDHGPRLWGLAAILLGSIAIVAMQT